MAPRVVYAVRNEATSIKGVTPLKKRSFTARFDIHPFLVLAAALAVAAGRAFFDGFSNAGVTISDTFLAMGQTFSAEVPESVTEGIFGGLLPPNVTAEATRSYEGFVPFVSAHPTFQRFHFLSIAVVLTLMLLGVLFLASFHSVRFQSRVAWTHCNLEDATHVLVDTPAKSEYAPVIALIEDDEESDDVSFLFHGVRYVLDFEGDDIEFAEPVASVRSIAECYPSATVKGLTTVEATRALHLRGRNTLDVPAPSFHALFLEHMLSPWFVFQVFCCVLWMMDDFALYPLMTLAMLCGLEAVTVRQRISALSELRSLCPKHKDVRVLRDGQWRTIPASDIVPGDVIDVTVRGKEGLPLPADLVLLRGTAVVDESILTGESAPQAKSELRELVDSEDALRSPLDMTVHASSILFSGTRALVSGSTPQSEFCALDLAADPAGAACLVIRTGFRTEQGRLVRQIAFAPDAGHSTDSKETAGVICVLVACGLASAWYVLKEGIERALAPTPKLILEALIVITNVVPPELPTQLTLTTNASLSALKKLFSYCTSPARLPAAGRVRVACFDKTGTITEDASHVAGVVTAGSSLEGSSPAELEKSLSPLSALSGEVVYHIGGCHGLSIVDKTILGDEAERACFKSAGFASQVSTGSISAASLSNVNVSVLHRHAFASRLRRMSSVATVSGKGTYVFAKGAPEEVRKMLSTIPEDFDKNVAKLVNAGFRVLALAGKKVESKLMSQRAALSKYRERSATESSLNFMGLLVIKAPLRDGALKTIEELRGGSIAPVMITGDALPTAIAVAEECKLLARNAPYGDLRRPVLEVVELSETVRLRSDSGEELEASVDELLAVLRCDTTTSSLGLPDCIAPPALVATGNGVDAALTAFTAAETLKEGHADVDDEIVSLSRCATAIVPFISVFARTSPTQKQAAVKVLVQSVKSGEFDRLRVPTSSDGLRRLAASVKLFAGAAAPVSSRVVRGGTVIYVGDGSNDVGALRAADAGVALYETADYRALREVVVEGRRKRAQQQAKLTKKKAAAVDTKLLEVPTVIPPQKLYGEARRLAVANGTSIQGEFAALNEEQMALRKFLIAKRKKAIAQKAEEPTTKFEQLMGTLTGATEATGLEDDDGAAAPGDASVAAPFTVKTGRVDGVLNIVKQGRTALVAAQMQSGTLALSCLVGAYSISVLALSGVRFGDLQMTLSGLAATALGFSTARPKSASHISPCPPPRSLFSMATALSIAGQALVQLGSLVVLSKLAAAYGAPPLPNSLAADFEPSMVNTVVFHCLFVLNVTTQVTNYPGHPHMRSFTEHKALRISTIVSAAMCAGLVFQVAPEINELCKLLLMPDELRNQVAGVLLGQTVFGVAWNWLCYKVFGPQPAVFAF